MRTLYNTLKSKHVLHPFYLPQESQPSNTSLEQIVESATTRSVVKEYEEIYRQEMGDANFKVNIPAAEKERKVFIDNLRKEVEAKNLERKHREEQDDADHRIAMSLYNDGSPIAKAMARPEVKVDRGALEVQRAIQEVYGINVEYDTAASLLIAADNNVQQAISIYSGYNMAKIAFVSDYKSFEETFNINHKGEVMLPAIYSKLGIMSGRQVEIKKGTPDSQPISIMMLKEKTLQELGLVDGSLVFVRVI